MIKRYFRPTLYGIGVLLIGLAILIALWMFVVHLAHYGF